MMKRKSHAPVPPAAGADEVAQAPTRQSSTTNRRKSVARKSATFDAIENRPTETTDGEDRPSHIIDYQLMIKNIAVFDLEDTGTRFDEQDPLVSIKIGDAKAETERQEDAGTNASFPESFVFDLTEEDAGGEIVVEVLNKSIIGVRKHVGKAEVILREAVPKCGKDTLVSMELTFKSKKGEKQQGRLTMLAQLVDMRPQEGGCCVIS